MDYSSALFRNRTVTDAFEPGSAIKVFTAAAALEKGFGPRSIFFCENGSYSVGKYTIHDTHPHGWLSINKIIQYSSNIGAAKIVEVIGDETLHRYLSHFGFGEKTGIRCSGETPGILSDYNSWARIDAGNIGFGQGMSASAIQIVSALSAIANNGRLMKPILIKKIISNAGEDIEVFPPREVRQVVSTATAEKIKTMMHLVVQEDGTGVKAAIEGYPVCGKTGTAQKPANGGGGYEKGKYISVFGGFAPQNAPRLTTLVVIDEPRGQYYGGDVAAPVFKTIMAESFCYLNIAPANYSSLLAMSHNGGKN